MFYYNKIISSLAGVAICLLALTSFIACPGSDSTVAGGGIGGTGIIAGAVSGIGSISVNNAQLDTTSAEVVIEGNLVGVGDQAVRDFLEIGMVVRVETVTRKNGTAAADRIVFNDNVEGPVQEITPIDNFTKKLTVMGQTVIVNDLTVLKNSSIDLIAQDNVLEVSGFFDSNGFIRATFVGKTTEVILPDTEVELKGTISNVSSVQETFQINLLTIDYSLADVSNLPGGVPSDGQLLEVKGTLDANAVLIADKIELEDVLGVDDSGSAEIQGIVSSFASVSDFSIGSVPIQTDAATAFEGLDPEEVDIETRLLVKGSLSKGILLADRVISEDKVKLKSRVNGKNADSLTLDGLDVIVTVNSLTKFLGKADSLEQINIGDDVRIFGRSVADNEALASKVMTKSSADNKVELKGPVTQVDSLASTFIILGTTVDTITVPEDGFELSDGTPITREEFFNTVVAGDIVNAKGSISGTNVTWTGIELQIDN